MLSQWQIQQYMLCLGWCQSKCWVQCLIWCLDSYCCLQLSSIWVPILVLHIPTVCLLYIFTSECLDFQLIPSCKVFCARIYLNVPVISKFIIMCLLDNLADSADCRGLNIQGLSSHCHKYCYDKIYFNCQIIFWVAIMFAW